jgi:hypothetical protein
MIVISAATRGSHTWDGPNWNHEILEIFLSNPQMTSDPICPERPPGDPPTDRVRGRIKDIGDLHYPKHFPVHYGLLSFFLRMSRFDGDGGITPSAIFGISLIPEGGTKGTSSSG